MRQYQHYKGPYYTLLHEAEHTETGESMCVYYANKNPEKIWIRPKDMFFEKIRVNGETVSRFKKV